MKKAAFCFLIILLACNNGPVENNKEYHAEEKVDEEKILRDNIDKYPDSLVLKENLIEYYRDSGHYVQAIRQIDNILQKDSTNARLWNIKAILHLENEDTATAISSRERSVFYAPEERYLASLGDLYAQTKNPKALQIADALLGAYKDKAEKDAYYIKGLYYSYINEKQKAIDFFDKCLSLSFTFMHAYREKAIALYDMGKYEEALAVLDKAITLQNNFDEGYYYSGKCLEKLNRLDEAKQAYKNALVYDPDYPDAKEALKRLAGSGR